MLDRGAEVKAEISAKHYRRYPLIQGGLEIPCKLFVKIPAATVKNNKLIDRFKNNIHEVYEEPSDEIIMGSLLFDDPTETEIDMEIESPAAPENAKKRKTDSKKNTEVKVNERTTDIRTFFTPLPNKVPHASGHQKQKDVIHID